MGIWGDMCVFVFKRQDEIRMKLIVNADDLGYSPHRDRGIFQAFYKGIVTSASLVVNGASSEQAVKEALSVGLEMGLHLNLTEGKPLTNVPSMVNTEGLTAMKKITTIGYSKVLGDGLIAQLERLGIERVLTPIMLMVINMHISYQKYQQ